MRYKSTRNSQLRLEASQVIAQGISEEGGLFVPESFPDLSGELPALAKLDYPALAKAIFSKFLTDFTEAEIEACVSRAYTPEKFGGPCPVKLVPLSDGGEEKLLLELWHGPTCAFKDMALQILPHFLTTALQKAGGGKEAVILTATSGDTGKAALEGFKDVPGTRILVFYPRDGVSPMQKRQMATQEGANVAVCAIEGNFDDAQSSVKQIFTDPKLKEKLEAHGMLFSSANSINWGRLLPQIVYYVYAYLELVRHRPPALLGEPMDVVVPTGNFGNILAAYYARKMGLPIRKLVCASNRQQGAHRLHPHRHLRPPPGVPRHGVPLYGHPGFQQFGAPALRPVLARTVRNSGRLDERPGRDRGATPWATPCGNRSSSFVLRRLSAGTADYRCHHPPAVGARKGYLCDTHTAVAVDVYRQYRAQAQRDGQPVPTVIASTANPYKFSASVLEALGKPTCCAGDDFAKPAGPGSASPA